MVAGSVILVTCDAYDQRDEAAWCFSVFDNPKDMPRLLSSACYGSVHSWVLITGSRREVKDFSHKWPHNKVIIYLLFTNAYLIEFIGICRQWGNILVILVNKCFLLKFCTNACVYILFKEYFLINPYTDSCLYILFHIRLGEYAYFPYPNQLYTPDSIVTTNILRT